MLCMGIVYMKFGGKTPFGDFWRALVTRVGRSAVKDGNRGGEMQGKIAQLLFYTKCRYRGTVWQ